MRRTANKIPKSWIECPVCNRPYGWINCRYTSSGKNGPVDRCLSCASNEKKQKR